MARTKTTKRKASRKSPTRKRAAAKAPAPPKRVAVSMTEAARDLGVHRSAVKQAIDEGRLVKSVTKTMRGKQPAYRIDLELAREEWRANTAPPNGKTQHSIDPEDLEGAPAEDAGQRSFNFANSRARKESASADKVELDVAQRRAALVSRSAASRLAFNIGRLLRDDLVSLPARMSADLYASDSAKEHEITLEIEVVRIADAIADLLARFPIATTDEAAA